MRHPYAQRGAFHALEHHRRRLLDRVGGEAGLEPTGSVLDEPRLLHIGYAGPGDPAEKGEELTAHRYERREAT